MKKSLPLLGVIICWLAVSGCPADRGPFGLFQYLPPAKGNSWTFGCVAFNAANEAAATYYEVRVEEMSFANCRRTWRVSMTDTSEGSESSSFPAGYYFLEDGVFYNTGAIPCRDDFTDPVASGFIPIAHGDLTPRVITDAGDPLRRHYKMDLRYTAGPINQFLPLHYVFNEGKEGKREVHITLDDFGPEFRSWDDCIALEAHRPAESGEPAWMPVLILGRDIGPILFDTGYGLGLYATLHSAAIRNRR
ncbi:MAG TPA: hypothetical protein P5318_14330 [Candidatus Hydrogenedentes bacterium]|nr:hypothetical protein [Candidatus Hydrogenedentota bacterium]HRT21293.1 hypothetical protein [Candidatus Hydrogenedentota bacterium]HRT65506.1 hypothetical protein [Candidatus Hydrogenedentota bacterium]